MNGNSKLYCRVLACLMLFFCLLDIGKAVKPVFQDYSPATITEGLQPGTFYYQFKATDSTPGHTVTYSLESKALEWFNIDSTTGNTTVKKTIDREVMGSLYRYKVFASDGTNTAEATVNQQIRDINDNPPVFSNLPKTVSINENSSVGSLVLTVTANDADSNPANVFEFGIESGNEEGRFEIPNAAEGKINLKKPLDYDDGTKQFVLRIITKNTLKEPCLNSTAVLTINVLDLDDLGAKFEKNLYEAALVEDSLPGTVVTTVQAKDGDSFNATVEYKIYKETNPGNTYKVSNNTGEITVNGPLTIGMQILVVSATSTKHPPVFTVVKITVAPMPRNDTTTSTKHPPSFTVVKTTVTPMLNTTDGVSAGIIIGFVILGIILALNTLLLGYIIWRGRNIRNYERVKCDSKRNAISAFPNIIIEERDKAEMVGSSQITDEQNVTSAPTAEAGIPPGPASTSTGTRRPTLRADYEDVNQSPLAPLHTYQALDVSSPSDQSSHAYESLHKYGDSSSSSTTV